MAARALMILGTASHAGKSLMTAAFCRILARRGYRVAPFKAQNMSLNSAATIDGYEIGRAQALQAEAAGVFATREMNPILMKPYSDQGCQIVANGRVWGNLSAKDYHLHRVEELFPMVLESYHKLAQHNDIIVLEGAGSPAEINLKEHDIVNMRMAAAANAACLLVWDIDRGGVFASLYGTLELLDPEERRLIRGVLINKFRGDAGLLTPGLRQIEAKIGKPCVGVVPHIPNLQLDEEDGVGLEEIRSRQDTSTWEQSSDNARRLRIAVIALPYLSNFTDFDGLAAEPSVSLRYVNDPGQLAHVDLIVIPGTKQTIQDFRWLRERGLASAIRRHAETKNTFVVGICGGMQMLGFDISDPHNLEGGGHIDGLGLLPIHTILAREKVAAQVKAELLAGHLLGVSCAVTKTAGYEIHLGETLYQSGAPRLFRIQRLHNSETLEDGATGLNGRCFGTYLHGLFDNDEFRHSFLASARTACGLSPATEFVFRASQRQAEFDRLADIVEAAVDLEAIGRWLDISLLHASDSHKSAEEVFVYD